MISEHVKDSDKLWLVAIIFFTLAVPFTVIQIAHSASDSPSSDVDANYQVLGYDVSMKDQKTIQEPTILPKEEIQNKKTIIKTNKGTIVIELYDEDAPLTVSNHIMLVESNFYDGLTFHRRETAFVIQGGDPNGDGTGGPGYTFQDEPVTRSYDRGIVAMANRGPDTNGSQFFIMLDDYPLPPNYTIFGYVTEGMDIVDQIEVGDVMESVEIQNK